MASTTLNHAERRVVQSLEMPRYFAAAFAAAEDTAADVSRLIVSELAA